MRRLCREHAADRLAYYAVARGYTPDGTLVAAWQDLGIAWWRAMYLFLGGEL